MSIIIEQQQIVIINEDNLPEQIYIKWVRDQETGFGMEIHDIEDDVTALFFGQTEEAMAHSESLYRWAVASFSNEDNIQDITNELHMLYKHVKEPILVLKH